MLKAVFRVDEDIGGQAHALAWAFPGFAVDLEKPRDMPKDPLPLWIPIRLDFRVPVGYLVFFGMIWTDLAKVAGSISVSSWPIMPW